MTEVYDDGRVRIDDVGITLSHEDDITSYESTRQSWKPATIH